MDSIKGKVVLITGASSGIGAETAVLFAKHGSRLALAGRNNANLEKVAEDCVEQGLPREQIILITAELTKEADVTRIIEETVSFFNTLDILVNSAGTSISVNMSETTLEQYDLLMRVNVRAVVQLTKLAIPYLKSNKGSVIMVSTVNSTRGRVAVGAYSMTKAALDMFTSVLSLELGPAGVRVNSVNPAWIRTPLTEGTRDKEGQEKYFAESAKLHPLQRVGKPQEVAEAIVFLASDAASFITGANLVVDGGAEKTASWFVQETEALLARQGQK